MATKKSTKVAKKKSAAPAIPDNALSALAQDAGAGTTDFDADDLAIPFVKIVQALSSERKRDGYNEGDVFNSVTEELYPDPTLVVPVFFRKRWIEWRPNRGGFVAVYDDARTAHEEAMPENEVVETAEHYVLIQSADGAWGNALISLSKSGHKVSKKWNSLISMFEIEDGEGNRFTPPMFGQVFAIGTEEASNDQGEWFVYTIERGDPTLVPALEDGTRIYEKAKAFREMLNAGEVAADYEKFEDEVDADDVDDEGGPSF